MKGQGRVSRRRFLRVKNPTLSRKKRWTRVGHPVLRRSRDEDPAGDSEGQFAGGDATTFRTGRAADSYELAIVFRFDGRSGDRVHVDTSAGNGAVRRAR